MQQRSGQDLLYMSVLSSGLKTHIHFYNDFSSSYSTIRRDSTEKFLLSVKMSPGIKITFGY